MKEKHWANSSYNARHPKLKNDTQARTESSWKDLPRGTYIQPMRLEYVPYGHWIKSYVFSETEHCAAYVEGVGLLLIPLESIDFDR